jgi:hypothetical protein
LIPTGERSGLLTHIATTESVPFVRFDKKLTASIEELAICTCGEFGLTGWRRFAKLGVTQADLNQARAFLPARLFASSGPGIPEI